MGLIKCKDCGSEVSSSAKSCPRCGAKVPRVKWWLWVPLGLGAAFIGYGYTIPEYEGQAMQQRKICESLAAGDSLALSQCDRIYHEAMERGKAQSR